MHGFERQRLPGVGFRRAGHGERRAVAGGVLLLALLAAPPLAAPDARGLTTAAFVAPLAGSGSTTSATAQVPLWRHRLLPAAESLSVQPGRLALDSTFTWAATGYSDARLLNGLSRALRRLEGRTGLILPRAAVAAESAATFVVHVAGPGGAVQGIEEDESYALAAGARQVRLEAPTVVGALRGLETLLQLVDADHAGWYVPLAAIRDRPRFAWRGLLIDVARHWEPPAVIERNLDAMAAVKLNVLHWHLSDDQGFRVESRRYPQLHERGSDGQYYTQGQIRAIVAYARDRGIRVVPEFDMPGHAQSWFVGYPQYASAPGPYEIPRNFGVHDAVFDPTREDVYRFLDGFVAEMALLFPDAYWHVGGDENNGKQWSANPQIQSFMQRRGIRDNAALQAHFNQRLLQILARHGKRMVGWDEILHPDLPTSIVIQSWRGVASLAAAARQGYNGILSSGYYLDAMAGAADHYRIDPAPDSLGLSGEEQQRVLGGEVCMWGEVITPETIDSRIWPRTAAIAERFWSPRTVTDPDDMYRRLRIVSAELEELGISTRSHAARMLSRLLPGLDPRPLETLLGVAAPTSLGMHRFVSQALMQYIPLTTLSDAAQPDPAAGREVSSQVRSLLADAPRYGAYRGSLERTFGEWRDAGPAIGALAERSPMVMDVVPVARDLADLGSAGLEALAFLEAGTAAPQAWASDRAALLARVAQPKANLRLVVVPALRDLITAAGAPRP